MKINWKVRIKNKTFWLTIIPMVLLLAQQVCAMFGIQLEIREMGEQLTGIVGTVFAVLALLGVVVDPTTPGVDDSARAMKYEEPGTPDD